MTAYQITSMMEGVVQRGTATVLRDVGKPIAGKTGTTNEEKDVWFIGFSPDIVCGVYMGYDKPRHIAQLATGGHLAAPVVRDFLRSRSPTSRQSRFACRPASSSFASTPRPASALAPATRTPFSRRSSRAPRRPTITLGGSRRIRRPWQRGAAGVAGRRARDPLQWHRRALLILIET